MIIDIFTYSQASSNCPFAIESLIQAAKCARLDGIAVTDRGASARAREYVDAGRRAGFLVLHGLEFQTDAGRMVAYPAAIDDAYINEDWRVLGDSPSASDVLNYFHRIGGIVIARDVFNRGEGLRDRVYSVKDDEGRGFDGVDTIAVYRRRIDNELSIEAQQVLGVPACAGSGVFDSLEDIGHCATLFADEIHDQASFVAAMRSSMHWACALRDLGDACPMGSESRPEPESRDDRRDDRSRRGERRAEGRDGGRGRDRRDGRGDGRRDGHRGHGDRRRSGRGERR